MDRRELLKSSFLGSIITGSTSESLKAFVGRDRFGRLRAEGRRRILSLPPDVIQTILGGWARGWEYLSLPVLVGLPRDVVLEGVHFSFMNRSFDLMLWHESFDSVPDGAETPRLEYPMQYVMYEKISDYYRPAK